MKQPSEVKQKLQEQKLILVKEYGVKEIGLFGSLITGSATAASDIDILVDFSKPIDIFAFVVCLGSAFDSFKLLTKVKSRPQSFKCRIRSNV